MCRVIVVDAGRSWSTNLGCDAYILIIALDIVIIIWSSISCPTVIFFTHRMLFSREKPLVKSMAPGSILYHICFPIYYLPLLFSDLLFQKPKNTLLQFFVIYFILRFREIYLSNLLQIYLSFTREGLTTPLTRRVASICSLCAGTVYIVLRGSPTSSITLVSDTSPTYL